MPGDKHDADMVTLLVSVGLLGDGARFHADEYALAAELEMERAVSVVSLIFVAQEFLSSPAVVQDALAHLHPAHRVVTVQVEKHTKRIQVFDRHVHVDAERLRPQRHPLHDPTELVLEILVFLDSHAGYAARVYIAKLLLSMLTASFRFNHWAAL